MMVRFTGSFVAATWEPRRRTAFFCPEARPHAGAERIGAPGGKAPMFCASLPKLSAASTSMGHP